MPSKVVQLLKVDEMILCLDDTGKFWLMMAELDQYGAPSGRFFYTALSIIPEPRDKGGN